MFPKLLFSITQCVNFNKLKHIPNPKHDCNTIVDFQRSLGISNPSDFQLPEPWSGAIQDTPILFFSLNPSIYADDFTPDATWPLPMVGDFFENRFKDRGKYSWVNNHKVLKKDGTYGAKVRYFSAMQKQADRLFGRTTIPGVDYTLSEIVHCKSQRSVGAIKAMPPCVDLFLMGRVSVALNVKVIVLVGRLAVKAFKGRVKKIRLFNSQGRSIIVVSIPHPNSYIGPKSIEAILSEEDLSTIRILLNNNDPLHDGNTPFYNKFYSDVIPPTDEEVIEFIKSMIAANKAID